MTLRQEIINNIMRVSHVDKKQAKKLFEKMLELEITKRRTK